MDSIKLSRASTMELDEPQLEMSNDQQYRIPTNVELGRVADLPVVDRNGKSRTFRSLWDRREPTERRNIIVLIRHFFCAVLTPHPTPEVSHRLTSSSLARNTFEHYLNRCLPPVFISATHLRL